MAAGDQRGSTGVEAHEVDRAIRQAEQASRYEFSVFVGSSEGKPPREFATRLHASLVAPDRSILIMVDPARRVVEVVTGAEVARTISDAEVELAVGHMRNLFTEGDLTGGLVRGIDVLAEHARAPRTLHTD